MEHTHYVGPGVADKMRELDDTPATCEKYPFPGSEADEVSLTWGVSGMCYVYLRSTGKVVVLPTLDMVLAGGVV